MEREREERGREEERQKEPCAYPCEVDVTTDACSLVVE